MKSFKKNQKDVLPPIKMVWSVTKTNSLVWGVRFPDSIEPPEAVIKNKQFRTYWLKYISPFRYI